MRDLPTRKPVRLEHYDYGREGAYFVTVCAQNRACLFGDAIDGEMQSNDAGKEIERWWRKLDEKFPSVQTDSFVLMPNHVHGIVIIDWDTAGEGADEGGGYANAGGHMGPPLQKRVKMPAAVQWFKTMTTNVWIRGVHSAGWEPFDGRLWQRSHYEHVIRNEESLNRIRQYIAENPARWQEDGDNPNGTGTSACSPAMYSHVADNRRGGPMCPPAPENR